MRSISGRGTRAIIQSSVFPIADASAAGRSFRSSRGHTDLPAPDRPSIIAKRLAQPIPLPCAWKIDALLGMIDQPFDHVFDRRRRVRPAREYFEQSVADIVQFDRDSLRHDRVLQQRVEISPDLKNHVKRVLHWRIMGTITPVM